jgi:hypothetical protein
MLVRPVPVCVFILRGLSDPDQIRPTRTDINAARGGQIAVNARPKHNWDRSAMRDPVNSTAVCKNCQISKRSAMLL